MEKLIQLIIDYKLLIAGGVLLAAFRAYLNWRQVQKTNYVAACVKFRSSVLSIMTGLYPTPSEWPNEKIDIIQVLEQKFSLLQAVVSEFSYHVPFYRRLFFKRAWKMYRLGPDGREIDIQYYWQYVPHSGDGIKDGIYASHSNIDTYQSNFKANIDRLLSFAKET